MKNRLYAVTSKFYPYLSPVQVLERVMPGGYAAVLTALARQDHHGAEFYYQIRRLCRDADVSRRECLYALKFLKEEGIISCRKNNFPRLSFYKIHFCTLEEFLFQKFHGGVQVEEKTGTYDEGGVGGVKGKNRPESLENKGLPGSSSGANFAPLYIHESNHIPCKKQTMHPNEGGLRKGGGGKGCRGREEPSSQNLIPPPAPQRGEPTERSTPQIATSDRSVVSVNEPSGKKKALDLLQRIRKGKQDLNSLPLRDTQTQNENPSALRCLPQSPHVAGGAPAAHEGVELEQNAPGFNAETHQDSKMISPQEVDTTPGKKIIPEGDFGAEPVEILEIPHGVLCKWGRYWEVEKREGKFYLKLYERNPKQKVRDEAKPIKRKVEDHDEELWQEILYLCRDFYDPYEAKVADMDWWDDLGEHLNNGNGVDMKWLHMEFAKMREWWRRCENRRPTPRGLRKFIRYWLERAEEYARRRAR